MRNSDEVQHRICGASQRHGEGDGVVKRGASQDVTRPQVPPQELHHCTEDMRTIPPGISSQFTGQEDRAGLLASPVG